MPIEVTAADGHVLSAYTAGPQDAARGLVVVQEIFGVNSHIRSVADGYAAEGYRAIAPALFDRAKRGFESGYSQPEIQAGIELMQKIDMADTMKDVTAALEYVRKAGKVGIVGYCWGGFLTWLSAARLPGFAAAVSYYGGGIGTVAEEKPRCPVLMHFGEKDHAIPLDHVEKVRAAHAAGVEIHVYPAGHGFNCDERAAYDPDSARIARERTVAFLNAHLR